MRSSRSSYSNNNSRGGRRYNGGDFAKKLHDTTCSDCGDKCQVPFKPNSGKPIFCSDCFEGKEKSSAGITEEQFELLNNKLDLILKVLAKDVAVEEIEMIMKNYLN